MRKTGFILAIIGFLVLLNAGFVFAQEENQEQEAVSAPETTAAEVQWLWGEAVSVDTDAKTILVKYLDYDTDLEKELTVSTNEKTLFENIVSLSEVKPQDTVSIDYIISAEGKNIAQIISVEKIEQTFEPEPNELSPLPEKVGPAEDLNNSESVQAPKEDNPPAAQDEGMTPPEELPERPAEVEEMPTEPEHTIKE
jgi:hypothetical protein